MDVIHLSEIAEIRSKWVNRSTGHELKIIGRMGGPAIVALGFKFKPKAND